MFYPDLIRSKNARTRMGIIFLFIITMVSILFLTVSVQSGGATKLTDDSLSVGTTPINEGATTTITIPFTNGGGAGTWENVTLTETGADLGLNVIASVCPGDNTGFKVNSIDISGAPSATDNGDGSVAFAGTFSAESVIWTIQACSSANSDTDYTLASQCNACTDGATLNSNGVLAVDALSDSAPTVNLTFPLNPLESTLCLSNSQNSFALSMSNTFIILTFVEV